MQKHINQALKLRRWVSLGHHFPGRVRLKYKSGIIAQLISFKSADVETALANFPGLRNYTLNTATGSLVIEYDASIIQPDWINALFSESETDAGQACIRIAQQLEGVNQ